MKIPGGISENLRFLIVEVESQVSNLATFLSSRSPTVGQRIVNRSGYAYNLKMRIHGNCFTHIGSLKKDSDMLSMRAMESISTDLERIAELCRDCVHSVENISNRRCLRVKSYGPLLEHVIKGVQLVENATNGHDTRVALKIGAAKRRMSTSMRQLMAKYTENLKKGKNTEDFITAIFVVRAVEQMGDALLNISEAMISANLGQPVNIERYHSLRDSVARLDLDSVAIESLAETRSGSNISGISANGDDNGYVAIFKEGQKRKVKEERQGVENWHEIFPGLAPKILSYRKRGQSASLLIEHLAGLTFEQILLNESRPLLDETCRQLTRTLDSVWKETRNKKVVPAGHMDQLAARLGEVYAIHPEFENDSMSVCGHSIPSFETLLKKAKTAEAKIKPPFSVYIHGDFNVDNIIYDPMEKRINFIDLHRSSYMDYVQDVSVFMVSNYRLQILEARSRARILSIARKFHRFAANFARDAGDDTYEIRLAFGLARSFATSTRFVLDKSLARAMYLRARYLIERAIEVSPKNANRFHLPIEEIFVD
ncbi:MAG: phosphotransferase [Gammaproteobacteria bacterium]|nr:phosphotransferase [Gammaproteobacteria bacterium]